ncbi:Gfo/Idh/MocA family protein [Paramaledivibacter caminithermalis]|jgi:predicted dehydrogenase|uniref:Oxidoreductase family, C-terminal alpha/beta domain n=1 Tax=Paramaledivibacter caminithermalis (strain DSM 15212 / CIP 107654 / DViRD3) TaxID=1121301 RepID=A0A1M6PJB5_PARC5|nr:Gfo/Idh/MocA family oxidoreductase [Paramaledivibacter caminithermalis]SHK07978.1 Oxidoreductase family, C-terminal alpha/beta domain [Paramaledivibacter caminithermalis DSM 15212]
MSKVKIALIGAGDRGKDRYGEFAIQYPENIEFVAVAEPNGIKRQEFANKHNIKPELQFESWEPLLEKDKFCDGVIIATQDDMHFEPSKKALEKGYHVLLEKPMSNDLKECIELGKIAKKSDKTFMICHVLRYTPFFSTIKKIIEDGTIGDVMSIQHNENIGYFHMAHSFVRGNWRNSIQSSPIILAKSCHDMDILLWLAGKRCTKISSFGNLSYFRPERAPEKAGDRCLYCQIEETCPYSAKRLYYKHIGSWPTTVITEIQTKEAVTKALEEGPYGKCVFKCDNDVCDHQVTIIEFEDGITATFNLSAFTNKVHRSIKIMGTEGEIRAIDSKNEIEVHKFDSNERTIINPEVITGGHGGGDHGIMRDFISLIKEGSGKALTSADISVESHVMAFAAEESRVNNRTISLEEFYKQFNN